jgi:hypothetical protein
MSNELHFLSTKLADLTDTQLQANVNSPNLMPANSSTLNSADSGYVLVSPTAAAASSSTFHNIHSYNRR